MLYQALVSLVLLLGATEAVQPTVVIFDPNTNSLPGSSVVGSVITANAHTTAIYIQMPPDAGGANVTQISNSIWMGAVSNAGYQQNNYSCVVQTAPATQAVCHGTQTITVEVFSSDGQTTSSLSTNVVDETLLPAAFSSYAVTITAGAEKLSGGSASPTTAGASSTGSSSTASPSATNTANGSGGSSSASASASSSSQSTKSGAANSFDVSVLASFSSLFGLFAALFVF